MSRYSDRVVADGATAYWRMGEASGHLVDVIAGNNSTAETALTYGDPGLLKDDPDAAIGFNGTTSVATIPDASAVDLGDVFSIGFWAKRANTSADHGIIDKGFTGGNAYGIYIGASGTCRLINANGASDIVTTGPIWTDTARHFVVFTKNGAALKAYFDGRDVTVTSLNATLGDSTDVLSLGLGGGFRMNGDLDEIALYKSVILAPEQVLVQFNVGSNADYAYRPIVGRYHGPRPLRRRFLPRRWTGNGVAGPSVVSGAWSDAVASSDAWVRVATLVRGQSESTTSADAWARHVSFVRSTTESVQQSDTWTRLVSFARTLTETVAQADAWSRVGTFGRSLTESVQQLGIWAGTKIAVRSLASSVSQSDGWVRIATLVRAEVESVASSDAWARSVAFARSLTSTIASSDGWTRTGSFARSLTEAIGQADTWIGSKLGAIVRTMTEAVTSSDAWTRTVGFARTTTESVQQADVLSRTVSFARSIVGGVAQADAWARTLSLGRSLASSVTHADALARTIAATRALASAVAHADVWTAIGNVPIIGGAGPTIASALRLISSAIARRLGPPDGGATGPSPGGSASSPRPGR